MKTYFILSGEGTHGQWSKCQTNDIAKILSDERCNGDRWAKAITDVFELTEGGWAGYDVETGEVRTVPTDVVIG